jgi:hypothetical protein
MAGFRFRRPSQYSCSRSGCFLPKKFIQYETYLKFRVYGNKGVLDGVRESVIQLFVEYQIRIQILIQIRVHTHILIKKSSKNIRFFLLQTI